MDEFDAHCEHAALTWESRNTCAIEKEGSYHRQHISCEDAYCHA